VVATASIMSRKYGEELDEDDFLDTRRKSQFTALGKKVVTSRSGDWSAEQSDSGDEMPREHLLPSMTGGGKTRHDSDSDDEGGRGRTDEGKASDEGKMADMVPPPKGAGVPPPREKPPGGGGRGRPSGAVSMIRKQLQSGMAPPGSPPPTGANLNARAMFRAKLNQGKSASKSGTRVPPPSKPPPKVSRFAQQAVTEIEPGGGDVYAKLRKEVVSGGGEEDQTASHPLFGVGDDDDFAEKRHEATLRDVFSHEWEVQGSPTRGGRDGKTKVGRRSASDGGRYDQPKIRSVRKGKGKVAGHGDVLGTESDDEEEEISIQGAGKQDERGFDGRAGPSSLKMNRPVDIQEHQHLRDQGDYGRRKMRFEDQFDEEVADVEGEALADDHEEARRREDEEAFRRRRERERLAQLEEEEDELQRNMMRRRQLEEDARAVQDEEESEGRGESSKVSEPELPDQTGLLGPDYDDITSTSPKSVASEGSSLNDAQIMHFYDPRMVPVDREGLMEWLMNPPRGGEDKFVRCYITRDRSGLQKKINPVYRLFLEDGTGNAPRLLLVAQKKAMTSKANVLISLDETDLNKSHAKRGPGYLGKLQSSKGESEYTLYDRGLNPVDVMSASHKEFVGKNMSRESVVRREMGVMLFQRGKGAMADRRMEVCIPSIIATSDGTEHTVQWRPVNQEDTMRSWFKRIIFKGAQNIMCRERMMCMHNRTWSSGRTSNLIDFMGRANETSVKNYQLVVSPPQDRFLKAKYDQSPLGTIDTDDVSNVLVQMGRDADRFNVDFQYPVPAFTAFAICLSRFVTKQSDE
jgi:hypothetical protein